MKTADIDTVTDEDIAYARTVDLNKALTVDEMPLIKALQSNKKFQQMYMPRKKSITLRLDEDIIAFFKKDGRGYQTRLNAVLRQAMQDALAH